MKFSAPSTDRSYMRSATVSSIRTTRKKASLDLASFSRAGTSRKAERWARTLSSYLPPALYTTVLRPAGRVAADTFVHIPLHFHSPVALSFPRIEPAAFNEARLDG